MAPKELCSPSYLNWQYCHATVTFIMLLITIAFTIKFCRNEQETRTSLPKILYRTSIAFIVASILLFMAYICKTISECYTPRVYYDQFAVLWSSLYLIQWIGLLSILFFRLQWVFNSTIYQLTKYTATIYIILFCFLSVVVFFAITVYYFVDKFYYTLLSIVAFVMVLISLIAVTVLFIYKLYKVYKSDRTKQGNNDFLNDLLLVITKNTTLALTSIGFSVLIAIALSIALSNKLSDEYADALVDSFYLLDITSNFLCIMLSFSMNKSYYYVICGCIDRKCQSVIINRVNASISVSNSGNMGSISIQSVTSQSNII
eukprot:112969_1